MQLLRDAFETGTYVLDLDGRDITSIIAGTLDHLVEGGHLAADRRDVVAEALLSREKRVSTAIGNAVAVPHAYLEGIERPVVTLVRLRSPINLGAPDGVPTRFVFLLIGPPGATVEHLDTLTQIARLVSDDEFRYELGEARSNDDLLAALERFRERNTAPPEPEPSRIPEGLAFGGFPGSGILGDLRRRWPHYWGDFRDGCHPKAISSALFLYFACLAPSVTFGGVMAVLTNGALGPAEMLVSAAFCGIVYALAAGQPLIILGGTGPLLIFTVVLYQLCVDLAPPGPPEMAVNPNVEPLFLAAFAWVGLWTAGFVLLLAVTDASCLMRYFTRFTDETFAALISTIYIVKAVTNLLNEFWMVGEATEPYHATALLSLLLALGTFGIASALARFRRSPYLRSQMREVLSDFGPMIAMLLMTIVAVWVDRVQADWVDHVHLRQLPAPDVIRPTSPTREGWLIDLWAGPGWLPWAAAGPAFLLAILFYLDQNITARLVNSPDHRLQKGPSYHWDLVVLAGLIAVCSLFGLPWHVAATVRSLNHVRALATTEEREVGGESRARIIHVRETRVTGLAIHVLIGCSLFLLPWLQSIPMAVLYGIFLYMGVVSMSGNQFFERLNLWWMEPARYPSTHYIRKVRLHVVHAFTLMQLLCLAVLWLVQGGPPAVAIAFPLFIALLVPVRLLAEHWFGPRDLAVLDAAEDPDEEVTHWTA